MLTRSLRKSLIYLESVSNRDIVVHLRLVCSDGVHTFHCNPHQALQHLFCSDKKFLWMEKVIVMCQSPVKILNPKLAWQPTDPKYLVSSVRRCFECRARKQQEWFVRFIL